MKSRFCLSSSSISLLLFSASLGALSFPSALANDETIRQQRTHHMLLPNWATQEEELRLQQQDAPNEETTATFLRLGASGAATKKTTKPLPRLFTTGAHSTATAATSKGVLYEFKEQPIIQNVHNNVSNDNDTIHGNENNNEDIAPQQASTTTTTTSTTTNRSVFRMPAEHEPVSMVIMAWDPFIGDMLTRMAQLIVDAGADVYMLISNYDYYAAPEDGIRDIVGLHPLHRVEYDSLWTRDYGPVIGILLDEDENTTTTATDTTETTTTAAAAAAGDSGGGILLGNVQHAGRRLEVVDPLYRLGWTRRLDDDIPCQLARGMLTLPSCRATQLILDGGNLMFDGHGALFTTLATYHWNEREFDEQQVDERLQLAFNVDTIHVLEYARTGTEPADGTGHVDMFAKILAPCVVIVAQTEDVDSIFYNATNQAAAYFEQLECQSASSSSSSPSSSSSNNTSSSFYQVHRVPGWWEDAEDGSGGFGTWYTYTNSLTVGNTVIVPSYYNQELNVQAQGVYEMAAPHLTVEFVNADEIIHYGGAVHCLTREVPSLRSILEVIP